VKKLALIGGLTLALFAGIALAANVFIVESPHAFKGGLWIGATGLKTSTNKLTNALYGTLSSFNFASVTITCEDSTGVTVTGAKTGDPCFVGAPTTISGAGTGLHSTFSCYVSAADTVKVRHCAAGTADDPAAASFNVLVLSTQ